jgi:hypothetical protein
MKMFLLTYPEVPEERPMFLLSHSIKNSFVSVDFGLENFPTSQANQQVRNVGDW